MKRRSILAGLATGIGAAFLSGCSKIAKSDNGSRLLDAAEGWHEAAHKALRGDALAPEYTKGDISPFFRGNGTTEIDTPGYAEQLANGFPDWRIAITGLVEHPLLLSMENLRRLPQRTQITRHDCVEGWSAVGEWTGPQLSTVLQGAGLKPEARYIVFRCADRLGDADYYESVDVEEALHPQTILAHRLNGEPLPMRNGAPVRVRIERQLGYKSAKYLTAIEAVESLDQIGLGKGGYWEDRADYQWYAGI